MTQRLFVYGTLAPGRASAHVLAPVPGTWEPATELTGRLLPEGWGAAAGYPGIILDDHGGPVAGLLFSSDSLAGHWSRLDAFEGDGYRRVPTTVRRPGRDDRRRLRLRAQRRDSAVTFRTIAAPDVLDDTVRRLQRVTPDTPRRWGTLTAHEMLCHLGDATAMVLGDAHA